jgi:hypothetical protein
VPKLVPIVEGDGEVTAVPVLLYKLLHAMQRYDIQVAPPKCAHGRDNLRKPDGLERFVRYAWKEPDCGAILILLDAEEDCPLTLVTDFAPRINALGVLQPVIIVCANRMFETWFLASFNTLAGQMGLRADDPPADAEAVKNPKDWLNQRFPKGRSYKERTDQETLTRLLDPALAGAGSRSFRRLTQAIAEAVSAIDRGAKIVTPALPPRSTS